MRRHDCVSLQGKLYTAKAQGNGGTGGVGLVLGAGNQVCAHIQGYPVRQSNHYVYSFGTEDEVHL